MGGPGQLLTAAAILDCVPLVGAVRLLQLSLILVPPPISPLSRRMPVTVLPRPLETCTSHSGLFFFSLLFPRLLPGLPGILLPSFCRPASQSELWVCSRANQLITCALNSPLFGHSVAAPRPPLSQEGLLQAGSG